MRALAKRAGISPSYITRIEGGDRSPQQWVFDRLATALGRRRAWLLTGEPPERPDVMLAAEQLARYSIKEWRERRLYTKCVEQLDRLRPLIERSDPLALKVLGAVAATLDIATAWDDIDWMRVDDERLDLLPVDLLRVVRASAEQREP